MTDHPEETLTKAGVEAFRAHMFNVREGLFYILNHEDELELTQEEVDAMYKVMSIVEVSAGDNPK